MHEQQIQALLEAVKTGDTSVEQAMNNLKQLPFEDIGYAKIDHHRGLRNGYPEVIYCEGKSLEQIEGIVQRMIPRGTNILLTRASEEVFEVVKPLSDKVEYFSDPRIVRIVQRPLGETKSRILVCTGGTSDVPVAEEAAITAETMGNTVDRLYDVGVAGIHRLLSNTDKIDQANIIIAVAGMEGALASVVGGLTDKPVIAVPTSVGYGAHLGGIATLLAMLNSCASGIGVVNIDNGFGAGYLASSINRQIEKAFEQEA